MPDIVKTMKLHIHVNDDEKKQLEALTSRYADACTYVSQYIFDNGFPLNSVKVQEANYQDVRTRFKLKSQLTVSVMKTVTARYKAVKEQLFQKPYKYKDEDDKWQYIPRTLEWLRKPIVFHRPQADLVRNRDYSFINGKTVPASPLTRSKRNACTFNSTSRNISRNISMRAGNSVPASSSR